MAKKDDATSKKIHIAANSATKDVLDMDSIRFRRGLIKQGIFAVCIKLLLITRAISHSTDMDVHLHWKALVRQVPISDWYTDESSRWTLDYPPLFAYFEYAISFFAPADMLVRNLLATDAKHVFFLRLSVISTDFLLIYATWRLIRSFDKSAEFSLRASALVLFCPALILIDNVHFQYNALPLSVLFISLSYLTRRKFSLGVAWFACAINLKHTLLPIAPALAITTLASIYRRHQSSIYNFLRNCSTVLASFLVAFFIPWLPFLATGGLSPVLSRLFPFGRGLLHSYWAANFWASYTTLDRLLSFIGVSVREPVGNPTSGIIGALSPFATLPNVTPKLCAVLIAAFILLKSPFYTSGNLQHAFAAYYSALVAFVFGWHVHEKNILVAFLPFAASMCAESRAHVWFAFTLLSIGGQFAIFPLVSDTTRLAPFRIAHFAAYSLYVLCLASQYVKKRWQITALSSYLIGTFVLEWYAGIGAGHQVIFGRDKMHFLPLMMVSLYSSIGVLTALLTLIILQTT